MATQGFAERISQIKDIGRDLQDDDVMGIGQEDSNKEIIPVNVPFGDLKQGVVGGIIKNPDMKDAFYTTEAIIHDKVNDTVDINPKWTDEFMVRRDSLEISYVGDLNADFLPFSFDFKITTGTLTMFEDMPVLLDGQYYIVKKSSFPVHNMVMNSRRYLYLELRNGVPVIFISTQVLPETYIRTCFGFYYFSNDVDPWVSEHQAFSYSRIGTYRVSPDPRGTSVPATYDSPARPAECWWLTKLYGPCAVDELNTELIIHKDYGGSRGPLVDGFYVKGPYDLYEEYKKLKGRDPMEGETIHWIIDDDVAVTGKENFWPTDDPNHPIRSGPVEVGSIPISGSLTQYYFPSAYVDNADWYGLNCTVVQYRIHRWADGIAAGKQYRFKKHVKSNVFGNFRVLGLFLWIWWLRVAVNVFDRNGKLVNTIVIRDTNVINDGVLNTMINIPIHHTFELEVAYNSSNPDSNSGGCSVAILGMDANPNPALLIPANVSRFKDIKLTVRGKVLGLGGSGGFYYNTSTGRSPTTAFGRSMFGDCAILNFAPRMSFDFPNLHSEVAGGGGSQARGMSGWMWRPSGATGDTLCPIPVSGGAPFGKGGYCENDVGVPTMSGNDATLLKPGLNNYYRSGTGGHGGTPGQPGVQFLEQTAIRDQWNNVSGVQYDIPKSIGYLPGKSILSGQGCLYSSVGPYLAEQIDSIHGVNNFKGFIGPYQQYSEKYVGLGVYSVQGTLKPGTTATFRLAHTWRWINPTSFKIVLPTRKNQSFGDTLRNPVDRYRLVNFDNRTSPGVSIEVDISSNAKAGEDCVIRVHGGDNRYWHDLSFKVK